MCRFGAGGGLVRSCPTVPFGLGSLYHQGAWSGVAAEGVRGLSWSVVDLDGCEYLLDDRGVGAQPDRPLDSPVGCVDGDLGEVGQAVGVPGELDIGAGDPSKSGLSEIRGRGQGVLAEPEGGRVVVRGCCAALAWGSPR